jgi:alcohol dehydrogenase class IV
MLPSVMRYNLVATESSQRQLVAALSEDAAEATNATLDPPAFVATLRDRIGAPTSLATAGVTRADRAALAEHTMTEPGTLANPRPVDSIDAVIGLLDAAW